MIVLNQAAIDTLTILSFEDHSSNIFHSAETGTFRESLCRAIWIPLLRVCNDVMGTLASQIDKFHLQEGEHLAQHLRAEHVMVHRAVRRVFEASLAKLLR